VLGGGFIKSATAKSTLKAAPHEAAAPRSLVDAVRG
jgi:hypothetical protein